jgi:predicted nuclease of predicted toxin-antitoxin system
MDEELFTIVYTDEDVTIKLARELRKRGYKAVTTQEAGQMEADDDSQLAYAATHDYAILTYNQGDFCQLHIEYCLADKKHAGIIIASRKVGLGEILRRLLRLLDSVTAEEMRGQIKFLSEYAERE